MIQVKLLSILPTPAGFAVFMKGEGKITVIYIDPTVGVALPPLASGYANPRPMTHDLIAELMEGFGISLKAICIHSLEDGVFKARLVLQMENEVSELKIVELDARSSDAMALSLKFSLPLYVAQAVWSQLDDVSPHYKKLKNDPEGQGQNMLDL